MYIDPAEGMVFRPPSEANSFILRATIGCSHNACSFCSMYKDVRFRIRPLSEIEQLIAWGAAQEPWQRRVFIADGNALCIPTEQLLDIIQLLKRSFPKLTRITCYAAPQDILTKAPAELQALKAASLAMVYLGIESGDDQVLAMIHKGATAQEMTAAGQKVLAAGMKLSAMIILGLGGQAYSMNHALHTAQVVSAINPTMLSALALMLHEGTMLRHAAERHEFLPLSQRQSLLELRTIIANIACQQPCIFRSNHVSNYLPLAGILPQDQHKLLADIDRVLSLMPDNTPSYNDRGDF